MNEGKVNSGKSEVSHSKMPEAKKQRGRFFSVNTEKEISIFKNELFGLTNNHIVLADIEFAEINRLVGVKTADQSDGPNFKPNLLDYIPQLKFHFELSSILKRIQPYCEFLDEAILPHMKEVLAKIRTACGCDLQHPQTWSIAQAHTARICEEATRLEISKLKLNRLYDYVIDDMEWFVMSFKSASWENKRDFFTALNKNESLLAWTQPWIDIAEGKETNWRSALSKSIETLVAREVAVEQRMFE